MASKQGGIDDDLVNTTIGLLGMIVLCGCHFIAPGGSGVQREPRRAFHASTEEWVKVGRGSVPASARPRDRERGVWVGSWLVPACRGCKVRSVSLHSSAAPAPRAGAGAQD